MSADAPETVHVPDYDPGGDCIECGGNGYHDVDEWDPAQGMYVAVRRRCPACQPRVERADAQALAGGNQLGGFTGSGTSRDAALANYARSGTQRANRRR